MAETYKCGHCKEVFEKAWSDEEALAEMKQEWGNLAEDNRAVVCDDCFNKFYRMERND